MTATPEARAKMEYIDYLRPIVADADTGCVVSLLNFQRPFLNSLIRHGGLSAVMKLTKLFAESGARVFI